MKKNTTSLQATVTNLIAGATYSISLKAIKNDATSKTVVLNGVTLGKLNTLPFRLVIFALLSETSLWNLAQTSQT